MPKLKDLIMEALPVYKITAYLVTDSDTNVTDIIDEIRAIRKVTIVNNITSEKFDEKNKARNDNKEEHFITIKFLSSDPQKDILFFKDTMMSSEKGDPNKKITGLQFIKFLPDTLSKM
jgi:ABC-type transporter Mla maintaining outer membrane lipid asymmetry ATPase subunit MlaF